MLDNDREEMDWLGVELNGVEPQGPGTSGSDKASVDPGCPSTQEGNSLPRDQEASLLHDQEGNSLPSDEGTGDHAVAADRQRRRKRWGGHALMVRSGKL